MHASYIRTHCIRTIHVPNKFNKVIIKPMTIKCECVTIVIALIYFALNCNVKTVPVEMVNFAMGKVDIFCKSELITV